MSILLNRCPIHHRLFSGCRFSRESTGGGGEPGLEPLTVRCVDSLSSEGVSQKGSRPLKALSVATLPALLAPPHSGAFLFNVRISHSQQIQPIFRHIDVNAAPARPVQVNSYWLPSHAPVMGVTAGWASSGDSDDQLWGAVHLVTVEKDSESSFCLAARTR